MLANLVIAFLFLSDKEVLTEGHIFKESEKDIGAVEERLNLSDKYYYQQLGDEEKRCYREICSGISEMNESIVVSNNDFDLVSEILLDVLKDHPEYFWCDGESTGSYYNMIECTVLKPFYNCSVVEKQIRQEEIDRSVSECLSGISLEVPDYEKILYVFEYLVNGTEYNKEASYNQNIYSALVNKETVCAGYAKAMQYLLNSLGVECIYVTGIAKNEPHAWNIVKCEGEYYHVDTTWGDPIYLGEDDIPDYIRTNYEYLCCNDSEIFRSHILDEGTYVPECTCMDWNYFVVNGMYYDFYDESMVLEKMVQSISSKDNSVVFKFSSEEVYSKAKGRILFDLVDESIERVYKENKVRVVQYFYQDDAETNKIMIYWKYE